MLSRTSIPAPNGQKHKQDRLSHKRKDDRDTHAKRQMLQQEMDSIDQSVDLRGKGTKKEKGKEKEM